MNMHNQEFGVRLDNIEAHHFVIGAVQTDRHHASGGAPHRAHIIFVEAQRTPAPRDDDEVLAAIGKPRPVKRVAFIQTHGIQPNGTDVGEDVKFHALDTPLTGQQRDVIRHLEVRHDEHRCYGFIGLQVEHVGDVHAARCAAAFGQFVDAAGVDASFIGEELDVVERARDSGRGRCRCSCA